MGFFKDLGRSLGLVKKSKKDFQVPDLLSLPESQRETPIGEGLFQIISRGQQDILQPEQRGESPIVGLPASFTDKILSPVNQRIEQTFKERTLPFIESRAGAAGRSRSSFFGNIATEAFQEKELQKSEFQRDFLLAGEEQRKVDIQNILSRSETFSANELSLKTAFIQQQNAITLKQNQLNIAKRSADEATAGTQFAAGLQLISAGAGFFGGVGGATAGIGAASTLGAGSQSKALDFLRREPSAFASSVRTT